jgi:hypothetical protein
VIILVQVFSTIDYNVKLIDENVKATNNKATHAFKGHEWLYKNFGV